MSAWVLPEHIADVLPRQARQIEDCRRALLDTARTYGYELVIPPLVEHIDSLLSGSGHALDLQTFKLVDLLSGRTLGVRADTTQQVARIDAHLLNREGVTRLCYCGPVLHTRPQQPSASREPLQLGAELYGVQDMGADLEVLRLALDMLMASGVANQSAMVVDLADARIVPALLAQEVQRVNFEQVQTALITKNAEALAEATQALSSAVQQQLHALLDLYGDVRVLERARAVLPALPEITLALDQLQWLCTQAQRSHPDVQLQIDLADARGYADYSGIRFAVYVPQASDALVRGGRYDAVGAVFGRQRPAVGFSLDVKALAVLGHEAQHTQAVRTLWSADPAWEQAVRALRAQGTAVVVDFEQQAASTAMHCLQELVQQADGQWVLQALRP